jgi:hypothetical protein
MLLEDGPHFLAASLPEAVDAPYHLETYIKIQGRLKEDHITILYIEVNAMRPILVGSEQDSVGGLAISELSSHLIAGYLPHLRANHHIQDANSV